MILNPCLQLLLLVATLTTASEEAPSFNQPGSQLDERRPSMQHYTSIHQTTFRGVRRTAAKHPNGKPLDYEKTPKTNLDPINDGWQLFAFAEAGAPSSPIFTVNSKEQYVKIQITDLFSTGDRFAVYSVEGKYERLLLETSMVDADGRHSRVSDPAKAFKANDIWSSGQVIIKPGKYEIIIRPRSSPYGGGTAAIRFDHVTGLDGRQVPSILIEESLKAPVCRGYGGYILVQQRADSKLADDVCAIVGLFPAVIQSNDFDLEAAERTHAACLDRGVPVWFNRYDRKNNYGLAMFLTDEDRFRVEIRDPKEMNYVLCQVKRYRK